MSTETRHDERAATLHYQADDSISEMDLMERVCWLQRRGISDTDILNALLDPDDHELDGYARNLAHELVDTYLHTPSVTRPGWLS